MQRKNIRAGLLCLSLLPSASLLPASIACIASAPVAMGSEVSSSASREQLVAKGIAYLRQAQLPNGSFSDKSGPGITGLVLSALVVSGLQEGDPTVDKAVVYLRSLRRDNGGIFADGSRHANYETCLALVAFSKLNVNGKYDQLIKEAREFLKKEQWDDSEGLAESDVRYGGAGYGSKSRPDLSNTSFLIEALIESGSTPDDPAIQRALAFVSRCQNLDSEFNDTPFAGKTNDGGFYYTPANNGESFAGVDEATGALRSYGSMSYAGLKSMIYAGVDKEDPRVRAVLKYLKKNYSVASNPGMGETGLYYYLQMMSKALDAVGTDEFETENGTKKWKEEVVAQLAKTQKADGSWQNDTVRWMEDDARLVTGYVLLTLANAQ